MCRDNLINNRLEPAFGAVANHRSANLAAYRKPDANPFRGNGRRFTGVVRTFLRLQDKSGRCPFSSRACKVQKIAAPPEALRRPIHGSGRQALAPPGPTVGEDAPAADRRFPGAKPVATLANEDAGLIGAFHD